MYVNDTNIIEIYTSWRHSSAFMGVLLKLISVLNSSLLHASPQSFLGFSPALQQGGFPQAMARAAFILILSEININSCNNGVPVSSNGGFSLKLLLLYAILAPLHVVFRILASES